MSTLALEGFTAIRDGQVAAGIAYLLVTFALGLVCASAGDVYKRQSAAHGTPIAPATAAGSDPSASRTAERIG